MSELLKKFGRYFLLDQIATGGMAEIYRARMASTDGAGRILVIKRIQAGYGANDEFINMFKSEIKVTMAFNHPNIVQVYDCGDESGQPYIAMEIVDGKNLRQFLQRFAELKQHFPVELASYIIEQSASALHYAHVFKDKITGEPLNIVHRDISPQNILISYEGNVKVIDFGIAKATTNGEATRAGVIKGKPSYLSPEQITGEELDGRCDVFALGIVLWELLTGRKLFAGENDLAVLKLIESCQTHVKPPSTLNPKVPKDLDYIVLKALAKQREKRYQTAEELQRALHKFLYGFSPDFNPSDLSYYAKDLFKNEIVEDRKKLQRLNEKAEQLLTSGLAQESVSSETGSSMDRSAPKPSGPITLAAPTENVKVEFEASPVLKQTNASRMTARPAAAAMGSATGAVVRPHQSQGTGVRPVSATSGGGTAQIKAPPQQEKKGMPTWVRPLLGVAAAALFVVVVGPELGIDLLGSKKPQPKSTPQSQSALESGAGRSTASVAQNPAAAPAAVAQPGSVPANVSQDKLFHLMLQIDPVVGDDTRVMVNDTVLKGSLTTQAVLGESVRIIVNSPRHRTFEGELVVQEGDLQPGTRNYIKRIQLYEAKFGYLSVRVRNNTAADVSFYVDGKLWTRSAPFENEKIPIGTYSVRVYNNVLQMGHVSEVTINEGSSVNLDDVKLEIMTQ